MVAGGMIVLLASTKRIGGLLLFNSRSWLGRFAYHKRGAGLLGQLTRLLGGAQQSLRNLLQVSVIQMRNSY